MYAVSGTDQEEGTGKRVPKNVLTAISRMYTTELHVIIFFSHKNTCI